MNTADPIRNPEDLKHIKEYYLTREPHPRNHLLIVMGLNTALRISDILNLTWGDVYLESDGCVRSHLYITEQKTKKCSILYLNEVCRNEILYYRKSLISAHTSIRSSDYLFGNHTSGLPISRVQAYRIIRKAAEACNMQGVISCHSLRKSFGYHAWKQGISPALLVSIYNHSSYQITKRYLGIEQEDRDQVFEQIRL